MVLDQTRKSLTDLALLSPSQPVNSSMGVEDEGRTSSFQVKLEARSRRKAFGKHRSHHMFHAVCETTSNGFAIAEAHGALAY
jgi:hypothetical protein